MKTIVKVEIQTYQITYMAGVLYMESEGIAIGMGILEIWKRNTAKQCVHRMAELDRNKK